MSLLSYNQIFILLDVGVVENAQYENVNSASLDLTLGDEIYVERPGYGIVSMLDKHSDHLEKVTIPDEGYVVEPGQFILACTREVFNLPNNISAEYKLKSTMARNGFNHLLAGWADAGWNGSVLTLEFHNVNQHKAIRIFKGQKCGQMIFFSHMEVPEDKSYAARGNYNGDKSVQAGKGLK